MNLEVEQKLTIEGTIVTEVVGACGTKGFSLYEQVVGEDYYTEHRFWYLVRDSDLAIICKIDIETEQGGQGAACLQLNGILVNDTLK